MADVVPEPIEWIWDGRIPRGKLTILDGEPGLGKSTLVCELAACFTTGRLLPGQVKPVLADVLILNAEDGTKDTIRARLDAAGADPARVHAVATLLQIPEDIPALEDIARARGARLIVLDPLMAYLSDRCNSFKDQHVRRALAPLAQMAERLGAGVLIVRHLNKRTDASALHRGGGSIGIIGAARSGLLVAADPDDSELRVLACTKSNLAAMPTALRFALRSAGDVGRVEWRGDCAWEANHLTAPPHSEEARSLLDDAKEFLMQVLAEGSLLQGELLDRADKEGIKVGTLKRAKRLLGVRSEKAQGANGKWEWKLPSSPVNDAPLAPLAPLTTPSVGEQP
jgi:hypothetical protein